MLHESLKIRVLEAFLETAKVALRGIENKKIQYILDDQTIEILNMEGEEFAESDYGILVTNTPKTLELEQAIKQYAQAFIQNGGSMSTIMDIYFSPSLMDMRRKLETAEEEMSQRQSASADEQNKIAREQMQMQQENIVAERELKDLINQRDNETKVYLKELELSVQPEVGDDGIENPLDREKFNLDVETKRKDYITKMKALDNDMKKHKDQMDAKKVDQSIARIKKKTSN
jgi:hypothetical protein